MSKSSVNNDHTKTTGLGHGPIGGAIATRNARIQKPRMLSPQEQQAQAAREQDRQRILSDFRAEAD